MMVTRGSIIGDHGNGVSTVTWTGKKLADWMGEGRAPQQPAVVGGLSPRFPLALLRLAYLELRIASSSWLDRHDRKALPRSYR